MTLFVWTVYFGCSDSSSDLLLSPLISTDLLCFPLMEFSSHLPTIPLEFLWELLGFVCERIWPVCGNSPTVSCPLTKVWPLERNPSPLGLLVRRWHQDTSLRFDWPDPPPVGGVTFEARAFDVASWLLHSQELKDESHKSRFSGESCVFALATLIQGFFWHQLT